MKNIEWPKWSAIAEIVSSIAILFTLAYLAIQTQQNTRALYATTRQASADAEVEWLYRALDTPELLISPQVPQALQSEYDPSAVRQTALMFSALFRLRESLWLQYQNGSLDENVWVPYRDTLANILAGNELFEGFWRSANGTFAPGFQNAIDARIEELHKEESTSN